MSTYIGPNIDIDKGKGTRGTVAPRVPNSSSSNNNRHCAAYEQVSLAVNLICTALNTLGYGNTEPIRKAIAASIMNRNTGE